MTSRSPNLSSDIHSLLHKKLDALLADCDLVAESSAHGKMLDDLDQFFFTKGRAFLREALQAKLQERIEHAEQTAETKECPDCKKKVHTQDSVPKDTVSLHGGVTLNRRYRRCVGCKQYSYPVDAIIGLDTGYTTGVTEFVSYTVGLVSYRQAQSTLGKLCQIHLSHETIGEIAVRSAGNLATAMEITPDLRAEFQKAVGETEFQMDGTSVNTRNEEGKAEWREMKLFAFLKRRCGLGVSVPDWESRYLPAPSMVYAFAEIIDKAGFQKRVDATRRQLGVGGITSALGDGAKWLWNIVFDVFGKTDECLDFYHAAEHLSDCGKVLFSTKDAFDPWFDRMRLVLLSEGFSGIDRELQALSSLTKTQRTSVESLRHYLRSNADRLNYAERLMKGRSIGSGLIEGACKSMVGKRLKQTGACWRVERANKIAILASLLHSEQWDNAWKIPGKV